MTEKYCWWISFAVTFVFACLVAIQWHVANNKYQPNKGQLVDELSTYNDLMTKLEKADYHQIAKSTLVPTGLFIQSLEFKDANDVNLTGYRLETRSTQSDDEVGAEVRFLVDDQHTILHLFSFYSNGEHHYRNHSRIVKAIAVPERLVITTC